MAKGLTTHVGEEVKGFHVLQRGPLQLRRGRQETAPVASGEVSLRASFQVPLGIPPQASSGTQASSGAEAVT